MLALQLAKRGVRPLLIDRAAARGRGIAYGTDDPAHLLNVPAMKMSAWPEAQKDFAESAILADGAFAERRTYGDYLSGQLDRAVGQGAVTLADGTAVSAKRTKDGWRIALADAGTLEVDQLVLATGNGRPEPFEIPGLPEDRIVQNPWGDNAKVRLAEAAAGDWPVLLIGTGLTMVDVVLTLDRLGHMGKAVAVSRRGLAPRAHQPGITPLPAPDVKEIPQRLSDALPWLRGQGLGVDWRAAVDSLRPITQALWASWPDECKARFLRHARPWWDVHRHRIAPEAAAVIDRWKDESRLTVMAARIQDASGTHVRVKRRGDGDVQIETRLAVNCTGPAGPMEATRNPLLRQLLDDGLVAPGELGIGLAVDKAGRAGAGLWAVGPLTKGKWWEITAVPDIRVQVEEVAERIAD